MDLELLKTTYVLEINDLEEKRQRCLEQLQVAISERDRLQHTAILLHGEISNARKMLQRLLGEGEG
jgi:FtsZ-binding cell division protein ZapB